MSEEDCTAAAKEERRVETEENFARHREAFARKRERDKQERAARAQFGPKETA